MGVLLEKAWVGKQGSFSGKCMDRSGYLRKIVGKVESSSDKRSAGREQSKPVSWARIRWEDSRVGVQHSGSVLVGKGSKFFGKNAAQKGSTRGKQKSITRGTLPQRSSSPGNRAESML